MDHPMSANRARAILEEASGNLVGWQKLLEGYPWFEEEGHYPIPAYSEFMPAPRVGCNLSGEVDDLTFSADDPYGWLISEMEEEYELKPGLAHIGNQVMEKLVKLGQGLPEHHIPGHKDLNLLNNPFWPPELAARAGSLIHERYVAFLPLALSKTQDDKGHVLWTLFGSSEQGPERVFWKGFYRAPDQELPEGEALAFFTGILSGVYGETIDHPDRLLSTGFRILPTQAGTGLPYQSVDSLPSWTKTYIIGEQASFEDVRYLLTFRPFSYLPPVVKERYLAGNLILLPFPGSLVFWGMPTYLRLREKLPMAMQIPLMQLVARNRGLEGLRVPQAGWLHEPHPDLDPSEIHEDLIRHGYVRTHRWERLHRYEDELTKNPRVDRVAKVLFSTSLEALGLYDKPMARNCQLWTKDFELLLDGPNAARGELLKAEAKLIEGGLFGYRFLFPAMRVGLYEVYWQRLLAMCASPQTGEATLLPSVPPGYLTAYRIDAPDVTDPLELWPRLQRRPAYLSALQNFDTVHDHYAHQTTLNILELLENWQLGGKKPLRRTWARRLLRIANQESLEGWLNRLPEMARDRPIGLRMQKEIEDLLGPINTVPDTPEPITYNDTATRSFEEAYWNDIQTLAHGRYINKDNADCIQDPLTLSQLSHHQRDLESLGDYLISRHRQAIQAATMEGKAVCGEMPFHWRTDFDYPWFGGWKGNQEGHEHERNILVVIPGKDHSQTVVMADHYDTAYMEDLYEQRRGGTGVRLAAAGADDNHSATAALLQAAPIFLRLAREGRLERDIWLMHLTGEEFPSDCMGARHFCQGMVEKTLKLHSGDEAELDLSGTRPVGVFVMDMIAHNRDDNQDNFQISPGKSLQSLFLAWQAHLANMIWNAGTKEWNKNPERHALDRGKRSPDGLQIPPIASYLPLFGEVRTRDNPLSSLFNTDGQIFSDIGAPVVLFMENYDINRSGYHDTKDTLKNIDLDYGSALAAIAIETVARVATLPV